MKKTCLQDVKQNLLNKLKTAKDKLHYLRTHDPITQLANRNSFERILQRDLKNHAHQMHAIMLLDIDNFNHIIELYGYIAQQQLLRKIAQRIRFCLKTGDHLARQESDKFIIYLKNTLSKTYINKQIKSIQQVFTKPFYIHQQEVHLSASIGISLFPLHAQTYEQLIHYAHIACHFAKMRGKNNHLFFIKTMGKHTRQLTQIAHQLHFALARQELFLHFQPQVDTLNQTILGFEALLRWKNIELGEIPPVAFIPLAEQNGLIFPISHWVFEEACKHMGQWQIPQQQLQISINVSAQEFQMKTSTLTKRIASLLEKNNIHPNNVELELTESSIIKNYDLALPILHALRKLGVRIACDDFGVGYSSLPYLKHLPIDTIKIDKSFIDDIESPHGRAIIQAIITIASKLNIRVIAEGVEKQSQVNILHDLGCFIIQGYYFSRPLPAHEIQGMIDKM